ncbi:hypothetical protein BKA70DRAFT_1275576 [Coprinopsis sp. MPI-PUGE-AT-0042]|nr:hypothetical protein BKA70DRAFT_1275576 [Coprinopsis sp. MPI-PUGE-AT-0042]
MGNQAELQHGYMFIGLILNVVLLGVMITQLYIYYTTYKRDRIWMKTFVAYLFLADVTNSIVIFAYLYRVLIVQFGDFERLFEADWVFASGPATTAVIGTSVQLFFAWRVRILTQQWRISWVLVGLVTTTALVSGLFGILSSWNVSRHPNLFRFQEFSEIVTTWIVSSAVCDAMITGILVVALRRQKNGFKRSDLIIDRIIRLIMQTGLLTMVAAALDVITFLTVKTTGLHLVFNYCLSKLYTNSLLSTLNSRRVNIYGSNVETDEDGNDGYSTASKIGGTGFTSTFRRENDIVNLTRPPRAEVFVQVEEHELADVKLDDSMEEINEKSSSPQSYAV